MQAPSFGSNGTAGGGGGGGLAAPSFGSNGTAGVGSFGEEGGEEAVLVLHIL